MAGVRKTFSPDLYRKYDGPAVAAVLSYLEEQGVYARVGNDQYSVDVVVYRNGGYSPSCLVEVEVVSQWIGKQFPYPLCNVPERKGKWMTGQLGLPCTIYRLSADLTQAILVPDYMVTEDLLSEVPNRLVPSGELFYRLPTSELEIISLVTGVE